MTCAHVSGTRAPRPETHSPGPGPRNWGAGARKSGPCFRDQNLEARNSLAGSGSQRLSGLIHPDSENGTLLDSRTDKGSPGHMDNKRPKIHRPQAMSASRGCVWEGSDRSGTGTHPEVRRKPKSHQLKGRNRSEAVIQVSCRERPLPDRKADTAYDEIIVRRGNRFGCPLSQAQADVGRVVPPSRLVATSRSPHVLSRRSVGR